MAALTANRKVPNILNAGPYARGVILDLPLGALEEVYQGALLSADAGDKYPAPLAANETYVGLALERQTGGATNGATTVRALVGGVIQHAITSIAIADIGDAVYGADDQTIDSTATGQKSIGRIVNVPATGTAIIMVKMTGDTLTDADA